MRSASGPPAGIGQTAEMAGEHDDDRVPFALPFQPPIDPMLAKLARRIPAGDDWLFEPKWDGFRALMFRDGDRLEIYSRKRRPLDRYFPELIEPLRAAMPERAVIDGEIVVPDGAGRGLDFDALLQRIHPAKSRIDRLASETPASFVAFDVLAVGDDDLRGEPMTERRIRLLDALDPQPPVYITPASASRAIAEQWFERFEGAGLDGVIAKPVDGVYAPGKRTLVKVKHERTAECAVPGYRIHKDGAGVGSLLLGLYDDSGDLHSVGVAAAFSRARRAELLDELQPRTVDALDGHPWRGWAEHDAEHAGPGGGSRWNAGKDLSFVPIRMGLVAEVTFGQLEGGRFRHGVGFVRWRPDRDPESCTFEQLDVADPVRFDEVVTASDG